MTCPLLTSLDVAEETLEKYWSLHSDPESARGLILLTREIAERLHELLPCEPAAERGQLRCSLQHVLDDVMPYVCQPGVSASAIQVDAIAKGRVDCAPGQYM